MPFIQTVIGAAMFVLGAPYALAATSCPRDATKASLTIFQQDRSRLDRRRPRTILVDVSSSAAAG
jgi:hypothetical protein